MRRNIISAALSAATATLTSAALILATAPAAAARTAPDAAPGMAIYQKDGNESTHCTLGYAASNAAHQPLAVTAGHCGAPGAPVRDKHKRIIGNYIAVQPDNTASHQYGYSIIRLRNGVATTAAITRSLSIRTQAQADTNDQVCMFGTTSGMQCGTVKTITPQAGTIASSLSAPGDSGGPIIRMTDRALVGILIGHNADRQETYFEPITNIARLTRTDPAAGTAFGAVTARGE
ncbi:hypothetical protein MAHJHV58_31820 [Mycobacterium avium subsp. hominissuis]|uniref:S1 family peptidase n=1 Tax=Mycobacterium avium TaxID=1764 RepID=UPI0004501E0A|nr:S1 family peptidase [Mycobacterium avium]ETZ55269.1 trypsin family protein [Mycobacterium avium MAV_120709_2344]MCA4741566.1 hypothetical protein [Mycobacterium avium subsp. hominissuis]MCA4746212.1 hypothetical protein [Mycobacterium avium subsp. hominissuis]MCA4766624.1 hypothetical protein [Mycobacterium avium subsp. hominissuis]MDO2387060.1 S1 family peptidase [Mycobacterium avium subsp. hominissuis]